MNFVLKGVNPAFRLRTVRMDDAENLRVWKNAHKTSFFYQRDITPDQQAGWMTKHLANKEDFMFIVEAKNGHNWLPVGCMGYRLEDGEIDLYNILRGNRDGEWFSMGEAFKLMCAYLAQTYVLAQSCVVLADNPVRPWYEGLGMVAVGDGIKDGLKFVRYNLPRQAVGGIMVSKEKLN